MIIIRRSTQFSMAVERIAKEQEITLMESILYICKEQGIDESSVPKLLTQDLKAKIESEAKSLNLIRKG